MDQQLEEKYASLLCHLDERQRRLVVAADARVAGRGGVSATARASGISRPTIHRGLRELDEEPLPASRVRRAGGGRKKLRDIRPTLVRALESLIKPTTRGDPESPLRWTCKSTRQLAQALGKRGYQVSHPTVAALLAELDYSLQANVKTTEGDQHPDRDAQFRYINRQSREFLQKGLPVISVDTKKKELVGPFAQAGREWRPRGRPEAVRIHDFVDPRLGRAIPYGVYDVGRDVGWVSVGRDHDTASFAVESIRRWWRRMGQARYPETSALLICADSGGSNGYRLRLWKVELNRFAQETGLRVTVCHFPPGTSKWNKVEHSLFSHITMNWRGRPLISYDVIVKLIASTSTRSGLRVKAGLDRGRYPEGVKVMDSELQKVPLMPHPFHGEWNYTIEPPHVTYVNVIS
jgi:hypothetical protein